MRCYEHGGNTYEYVNIELDFSININPLGMPQTAKNFITDAMESYARYPDYDCRVLRAMIANKYDLRADSILCGNGASDLIMRVCACFKPKNVLALAPTFSEYARCAVLFGGNVREYALKAENGFVVDSGILDVLTADVDAFFLCNPNNPTGRLIDAALLETICKRCCENEILLIIDECFIGFTEGKYIVPALFEYPNLLLLNAFTKFYGMAGLRLGYMLGAPELLSRIAAFGAEWSVSAVAQVAGIAALQQRDWEERTLSVVQTERAYMQSALRQLGLTVFPSDCNYLLLKSPIPLYEPLLRKCIFTRSCKSFVGLDESYIRIGLKTHERNEALVCAIKEVLNG